MIHEVRANSQNRRTTAALFCRAKANPISDSGSRSAIEHTATLETILFATDAGTIETPTPASTREMSVGISPAVWTTLGTTPALLKIPVKRSWNPGAYSRAYMTNGFPLSSRKRISFLADRGCHEGKIAINGSL